MQQEGARTGNVLCPLHRIAEIASIPNNCQSRVIKVVDIFLAELISCSWSSKSNPANQLVSVTMRPKRWGPVLQMTLGKALNPHSALECD